MKESHGKYCFIVEEGTSNTTSATHATCQLHLPIPFRIYIFAGFFLVTCLFIISYPPPFHLNDYSRVCLFFPLPPSLPLFLSLFLCFFLSGVLRVCLYLPAQSKEKISGEICRVNCSGWEGRRRRGRRGVLVSRWWMEIVLKEARATESDSFLSFSLIFSLLLLLSPSPSPSLPLLVLYTKTD